MSESDLQRPLSGSGASARPAKPALLDVWRRGAQALSMLSRDRFNQSILSQGRACKYLNWGFMLEGSGPWEMARKLWDQLKLNRPLDDETRELLVAYMPLVEKLAVMESEQMGVDGVLEVYRRPRTNRHQT